MMVIMNLLLIEISDLGDELMVSEEREMREGERKGENQILEWDY